MGSLAEYMDWVSDPSEYVEVQYLKYNYYDSMGHDFTVWRIHQYLDKDLYCLHIEGYYHVLKSEGFPIFQNQKDFQNIL